MKTTLTIEQSAELIKRGVSADKASKMWVDSPEGGYNCEKNNLLLEALVWKKENDSNPVDFAPIFTLADLLSLLPKKLYGEETDYCDCELHIHANKLGWSVSYMEIRGSEVAVMKLTSYGVELIDALFSLLCKLLNNHVKLD